AVLAGYLQRIPPAVVARFRLRLINIHPALLPAFGGPGMYGRRVHEAVLASGAPISGATVHYVDEEYDRGPIIAQWPVPVRAGDTPESLAARVLEVEHRLLPRVVLELALADSLLALVPGSARDRAGNITLTLGAGGGSKRLVACPLDEAGYVVGSVTDDGYLTLRRVGTRAAYPLFDQQVEGQAVTV